MARRLEDRPDDPVLVVIEDEELAETFDDWLAVLDGDAPTEVNAEAAEILRDIREHGEH
jgi:hypothetical protein